MSKNDNISSIFPKHLFWDIDMNKLSFENDMDIIIPRALFYTNKKTFDDDFKKIEALYSKPEILKVLKTTKERITNEICVLVANKCHVEPFYRYKI